VRIKSGNLWCGYGIVSQLAFSYPFNGTPLANLLRTKGIETLALMRVWTNFVVESAARTGADSSYRVVVVTDGCASDAEAYHQFFIDTILPKIGLAATANDVIEAFGSAQ
jgi:nicotinamidase-related amidase